MAFAVATKVLRREGREENEESMCFRKGAEGVDELGVCTVVILVGWLMDIICVYSWRGV